MSDQFDPNSFFQNIEKKRNYDQLKSIIKKYKDAGFDYEEILALVDGHFDKKLIPLIKLWVSRIWEEFLEGKQ